MTDEPVTISEMVRVLQSFKEDVREDFRSVNNRLDNMNMVHVDVYAADRTADAEHRKSLTERVSSIESRERESSTWSTRYLLALLVTLLFAIASAIVSFTR